tara:strand:+ start:25378 stop:25911 length:534 start_codon:yes stop_codon:yes gene_type:complete
MIKKAHYTWKDIEHMITSINNLMFADGWRPDMIIGMTRGGLVPAVILSNMTGIKMYSLDVRFRDITEGYQPESLTWAAHEAFVGGKNILVFDDINDTGKTLEWVKQDWETHGRNALPANELKKPEDVWHKSVRFACLIDNGASEFDTLDYTALEINKSEEDVWIVFPWEGERDYGKF